MNKPLVQDFEDFIKEIEAKFGKLKLVERLQLMEDEQLARVYQDLRLKIMRSSDKEELMTFRNRFRKAKLPDWLIREIARILYDKPEVSPWIW